MAASIRDVAEAAAVSVGTVSNVLNRPDKVAPETVARVQGAIDRLGFVRNDAARQLRAGRSRSIGLVVLDAGNPFFADVMRGAEARAARDGLMVLIGSSDDDVAREASYLDLFGEQRVNGVLVTPASTDLSAVRRLREAGTRVVLVDYAGQTDGILSVAVDDVEGGRVAAAHLLGLGRRRLAFIGGELSIRQVADRLEGARRAVAGVPGAVLDVVEAAGQTVLAGRAAGERLLGRPVADRPDAVFAANDLLAIGVLQALTARGGIRVPDDMALIGYDDIDFAAAAMVPLSSVRQPAALIGSTAVDLLLREGSDGPASVRFVPELVVRASTGG